MRLTEEFMEKEETDPAEVTNPASASESSAMKVEKNLEAETVVEAGKHQSICLPPSFFDEVETSCFE